jgi:phenylacetate-CoA ligase
MLRNQKQDQDFIEQLQAKKLRRLLEHVDANVPFYARLYRSQGFSPQDFTGLDDLDKLPFVRKRELQSAPREEVLSRTVNPEDCKVFATSGTTGIPLKTYFSSFDSTLKNLGWIRAFWNTGMRPWQRAAAFIGQKQINDRRSWYEYLGLWRRSEISTWEAPQAWLSKLRRWKPHTLQGYVMTLKILAAEMRRSGDERIKPRFLFHSSALLDQGSRQHLEEAFGCAVTDIYGSDEAGCIAWECKPCGGYHLNQDMLIVEVLNEGKPVLPGEAGEVVVTNLHSYVMPFIRYRQGDVVTLSSKTPVCGCRFPLIERIEGRSDDFIYLADGRRISPHPVYHSIDPVPGVRMWRLLQDENRRLRLEIEPTPEYSLECEASIRRNLEELFRQPLDLEVVLKDTISVEPGRKFRSVSSKGKPN